MRRSTTRTPLSAGQIARFWARVEKTDGCWLWKGEAPRRYGKADLIIEGRRVVFFAHRLAWELMNGPIPDGLDCLHGCDNPGCVRPHREHVHLGTHAQNMAEAGERGLMRSGERHSHAKLSDADALVIARSREPGHVLAKRYGVSQQTVCDIRKGRIRAKTLGAADCSGEPQGALQHA